MIVQLFYTGMGTNKKYTYEIDDTEFNIFLIKCANEYIFYAYCDFRDFSLSYTVCGYVASIGKQIYCELKDKYDYGIYTEYEAGGMMNDDPPQKDIDQAYTWCTKRYDELTNRGWTFNNSSDFNGFASTFSLL